MSRSSGANAIAAIDFETTYGTPRTAVNYKRMPFVSSDIGMDQLLIDTDVLGYGREPQRPSRDVINNRGTIAVPLDLRDLGWWLRALFGAPTTTQGVAATGSYTFTAQPATSAIITVGGQAFTFVAGAPAANQIQIAATLALTIANAVFALNASVVAGVSVASYRSNLAGTQILITYDTVGTGGNAMTIVAGTSPATNATVSAATLTGGSAAGQYNHVFTTGAVNLPSLSIEIGRPDVPAFEMNFGMCADTLAIPFQRSGNLGATIGMIGQGESPATATTAAGTITSQTFERFSQFSGGIYRDGVPFAELESGTFNFSNGLDPVEVIRSDGLIAGADPGLTGVNGDLIIRYSEAALVLLQLAQANTAVEIVHEWSISSAKKLTLTTFQADLPIPKRPITGPGGIRAPFNYRGSQHPTTLKSLRAVLANDVVSYA